MHLENRILAIPFLLMAVVRKPDSYHLNTSLEKLSEQRQIALVDKNFYRIGIGFPCSIKYWAKMGTLAREPRA